MHHKLDSLWKIEYELTVNEDSILLYSRGRAKEEAEDVWMRLGLKEDVARQIEELPVVFGETLDGNPVISGNEVKGIFRSFIAASLTSKGHTICIPSTKRHMIERERVREYYIPQERLEQCPAEDLCFACRWFGAPSYESPLRFSFLVCDKPFKEVVSSVIPMIAVDEQFGGTAGGALIGFIGVKGGTTFRGEISGVNLNDVIIGALYDVVKASEAGLVKFGRLKTRGFGTAKISIKRVVKYEAAPFREVKVYEYNELKGFLDGCLKRYAEFASKPSRPEKIAMRLVERKGA